MKVNTVRTTETFKISDGSYVLIKKSSLKNKLVEQNKHNFSLFAYYYRNSAKGDLFLLATFRIEKRNLKGLEKN